MTVFGYLISESGKHEHIHLHLHSTWGRIDTHVEYMVGSNS